jgi:hypothetical protein
MCLCLSLNTVLLLCAPVPTAPAVLLGALSYDAPVRTDALLALLDFLCHDFPKVTHRRTLLPAGCAGNPQRPRFCVTCPCSCVLQVRKTTAERLYVRILTIEDKFPTAAVDSVLAVLTETPWMGPLPGCVGPRDSLYAFLDVAMPGHRSGIGGTAGQLVETTTEEVNDHCPVDAPATASGDGETFDSYGALVKEAGY